MGIVAAAADDDDDDFFAEFDVDLDMDGDSAPSKQALSTIPEKSGDMDINAASESAADEADAVASPVPMAIDESITEPAAPDAAPQASDGADVQPGWRLYHARYSVLWLSLLMPCCVHCNNNWHVVDPAGCAIDMQGHVMAKPA